MLWLLPGMLRRFPNQYEFGLAELQFAAENVARFSNRTRGYRLECAILNGIHTGQMAT
jgi:hypothetical protein